MRRYSTYSLVLFAVAGAAFVAGGWHSQKEAVSAAAPHVETSRRVLYYSDGMHPQIKAEKPGSCPICGMTLEPVYADAQAGAAASTLPVDPGADGIAVSAETQQLLGVRVGAAEAVAGADRLHLFGRVVPDETRLYTVNFGADGYTRELAPVTTGTQVTKDQWLATISVPESRQPVQGFLVTVDVLDREIKSATHNEAQVELARASVEVAADKLLTLGMSQSQLDELRHTHRATSTFRITAPGNGFVLARNVSLGQKIEKGQEIFKLADLRR